MRRKDREINGFEDMISVMEKCDVCRLGLQDEEYPYILPMNFGLQVNGKDIALYFHGADTGKKYDLIRIHDKVGFEMDCSHKLVTDKNRGNCTMEYESIIGCGTIDFIYDEDEKYNALCILMEHYAVDKDFEFDRAIIPRTTVMKLTVKSITGKRRIK